MVIFIDFSVKMNYYWLNFGLRQDAAVPTFHVTGAYQKPGGSPLWAG
jgi:hypothetical protein